MTSRVNARSGELSSRLVSVPVEASASRAPAAVERDRFAIFDPLTAPGIRRLGHLRCQDFDTSPDSQADVHRCSPLHICRQSPDQPLWVAQPTRGPVGLGAAGWQQSTYYDRRSLRELAPKRLTQGTLHLGGPRRSLSGSLLKKLAGYCLFIGPVFAGHWLVASCGVRGALRTGGVASPGRLAACLAGARGRPESRPGCWSGGQHPGAAAPGQAPPDQGAQVQRGGAALEPGVVLGRPAVAEPEPAAPEGGHLATALSTLGR